MGFFQRFLGFSVPEVLSEPFVVIDFTMRKRFIDPGRNPLERGA